MCFTHWASTAVVILYARRSTLSQIHHLVYTSSNDPSSCLDHTIEVNGKISYDMMDTELSVFSSHRLLSRWSFVPGTNILNRLERGVLTDLLTSLKGRICPWSCTEGNMCSAFISWRISVINNELIWSPGRSPWAGRCSPWSREEISPPTPRPSHCTEGRNAGWSHLPSFRRFVICFQALHIMHSTQSYRSYCRWSCPNWPCAYRMSKSPSYCRRPCHCWIYY